MPWPNMPTPDVEAFEGLLALRSIYGHEYSVWERMFWDIWSLTEDDVFELKGMCS